MCPAGFLKGASSSRLALTFTESGASSHPCFSRRKEKEKPVLNLHPQNCITYVIFNSSPMKSVLFLVQSSVGYRAPCHNNTDIHHTDSFQDQTMRELGSASAGFVVQPPLLVLFGCLEFLEQCRGFLSSWGGADSSCLFCLDYSAAVWARAGSCVGFGE